jgi:hypothetical protein
VISIRREGSDDMQPVSRCTICRKALPMSAAWVAFPVLAPGVTQTDGQFVHRSCIDGRAQETIHVPRFMLWRGVSLLECLLRKPAGGGRRGLRAPKIDSLGRSGHRYAEIS